jgi:UDP-N-acetylglucosamine 2-epimerase (non-hydrolysing)
MLSLFEIQPEHDLNLMRPGQTLPLITSGVLCAVGEVVEKTRPDWVIVQGDTTTAFAGALAAFYQKVRVAHVEAGLRTGNLYSPWPEEANRKLVGQLAALHFAPTELSRRNLIAEGVPEARVSVTGNTVIDALQWVSRKLDGQQAELVGDRFSDLRVDRRLILVTAHRRENFDGGLSRMFEALRQVAERGDVEIVYPVHLNPNVREIARNVLGRHPAIKLIEPLDYPAFVYLMKRAYLVVTDSGGVQEEAPGLGKPVLVTRDTTERPEAIEAGTARLVGTSKDALVEAVFELLDNPSAYKSMANATNPYGDGTAAQRILERLISEPAQ